MADITCQAHNISFPRSQTCPLCKTDQLKREQEKARRAEAEGCRPCDDAPVDETFGAWCEWCGEFYEHQEPTDHLIDYHSDAVWPETAYMCHYCGTDWGDSIRDAKECCHEDGVNWECTECGSLHLDSETAAACCYNAKTEEVA